MRRVVVTGLGFICSIGNDKETVCRNLREGRHGIELFDQFQAPSIPVKLAGTVKGFQFPTSSSEDWIYPERQGLSLTREQLRWMTPNALYAYFAMHEAIADARLASEDVSNPRTCLMCASGGSMWLAYENLHIMQTRGVQRCPPGGIVNGIPGSLYVNLSTLFHIRGPSLGFSSACASSAHALGNSFDLISSGRQDVSFVVGAEDCHACTFLPFATVRALSPQTDPDKAPCAFDRKRDGFVATGGGAVLILEERERALKRGAPIYAEVLGWGQTSDGYNVMIPEPQGEGLARCMSQALEATGLKPESIDYINAHATSTPVGDAAEVKAIERVFNGAKKPYVSSTKSLTGHGLSLAGALEAGLTCLAIKNGFTPVSAKITELDPACSGVPIVTQPIEVAPRIAMSNSSGFGGSNVSLIFQKPE